VLGFGISGTELTGSFAGEVSGCMDEWLVG
jgi:hypothetical protein